MKEITQEYLQLYLKEAEFDLLPTQDKISYPLICKYLRMLEQGQLPPAIKTEFNAIVDGLIDISVVICMDQSLNNANGFVLKQIQ